MAGSVKAFPAAPLAATIQSPAGQQRPEGSASPPERPEKLTALLAAARAGNGKVVPHEEYASKLLRLVEVSKNAVPGTLSLKLVPQGMAAWLQELPPLSWSLLGDLVADSHATPLRELRLPRQMTRIPISGLKQLTSMESLILFPKGPQLIDFRPVHSLRHIRMDLQDEHTVAHVMVRDGTFVRANAETPVHQLSCVSYFDDRGQVGSPQPPSGLVYRHQAGVESIFDGAIAQEHAAAIQLNGRVAFSADPSEAIVCRHIVGQWGADQFADPVMTGESKDRQKPIGDSKRPVFTYEKYAHGRLLAAHVPPATQSVFERLNAAHAGKCAIHSDRFGEMLADKFRRMREGDRKVFFLWTPNHAMGLRLDVFVARHGSQLRTQYAFDLYDPNKTASPVHCVHDASDLNDVGSITLRQCLEERMDSYFPRSVPAAEGQQAYPTLMDVIDWDCLDPAKKLPPEGDYLASPQDQASYEYLRIKLRQGDAAGVSAYFDAAVAVPPAARECHHKTIRVEIIAAVRAGHSDAVGAYLSGVLKDPSLTESTKQSVIERL